MPKQLLVTGHKGYLGSVMVPVFSKAGYQVTGLDTGFFNSCTLTSDEPPNHELRKDIRDLTSGDLNKFYAVVHLAALSNDPIGNLNPLWTEEINLRGSIRLAELAKAAGVQRFLFSSSCIMYGQSQSEVVTEESPLDPKTDYARSKVLGEQAISQMASREFSPTFMRNGTIYGVSPRMRFDTVFNNLMGSAVSEKKVKVYSDGKPWRPVIHIEDVARAFLMVLDASIDLIHNQAFNIGANHLNHQVIELAETAVKTVPGSQLELVPKSGADQRTYKADFGKFFTTFQNFSFNWDIQKGAEELLESFERIGVTTSIYFDKRFTRLKWLQHLLDTQQLDNSLRWTNKSLLELKQERKLV